jgi:hypothetical protein
MLKRAEKPEQITKSVNVVSSENINEDADAETGQSSTTSEERRQLIAIAAYFRAEQRGFSPGFDLEDWLEAEAEIDAMFRKC